MLLGHRQVPGASLPLLLGGGLICVPLQIYVPVLKSCTSECDLIWKWGCGNDEREQG